jgi:hypothetical protein
MEDTQDFARHDKVPSGRSAAYGLARLVIHVGMYVLCRKDVVKVLETVVDMTGWDSYYRHPPRQRPLTRPSSRSDDG